MVWWRTHSYIHVSCDKFQNEQNTTSDGSGLIPISENIISIFNVSTVYVQTSMSFLPDKQINLNKHVASTSTSQMATH